MSTKDLIYTSVNSGNIGLLDSIKTLYIESFPEEERRPWDSILSLIESDAPFYKFIIVSNTDGTVGFYSTWRFPEAIYMEHFAVSPKLRGKGIGSEILEKIRSGSDGLSVVVEVEPAGCSPEAGRRIGFYERAGFTAIYDFNYVQPPYAKGLPEVPMILMSTHPICDLEMFVLQLHTLVYNK